MFLGKKKPSTAISTPPGTAAQGASARGPGRRWGGWWQIPLAVGLPWTSHMIQQIVVDLTGLDTEAKTKSVDLPKRCFILESNRPRVLELNLNGTSEHLFVRHPVNLRHLFPLAVQEAKSKMPRKAAKLTEAPWYEEWGTWCLERAPVYVTASYPDWYSLCVCASASMNIYIYIYMCVCKYIYIYICVYIYIYMCVCVCVSYIQKSVNSSPFLRPRRILSVLVQTTGPQRSPLHLIPSQENPKPWR